MVGFDTIKILARAQYQGSFHHHPALRPNKVSGSKGKVWYRGYDVPDLGTSITVKGIGQAAPFVMWEGSVPKILGLQGVASDADVLAWEDTLRSYLSFFDGSYRGRVDVTCDLDDPDGILRQAAKGWKPHDRARYVEAVYQGGETVWIHNKRRGVRVYDKFAECGFDWARGKSRVEYQIRGDWVQRLGLRDSRVHLGHNARESVLPLVSDLVGRAYGSADDLRRFGVDSA